MSALPEKKAEKTFCIEFDSKDAPGLLKCTQITIETVYKRDDDVMNIAPCDHPLYSKLTEYVLANPPRKTEVKNNG